MRLGFQDLQFSSVPQLVALVLLKIKLLLDLKALESDRSSVPRSNIIASNLALSRQQNMLGLELQAYTLYSIVRSLNPFVWLILQDPLPHLAQRPAMFSPGSLEQAQLTLVYSYRAWVETPGALELVKEKVDSGDWALPPDSMRPNSYLWFSI